jgi:hypothetical protein
MPNSMIIDEAIHPDTDHKDLKRIVAIAIDEGSAEYVFDWAMNNFISSATDLVRTFYQLIFLAKNILIMYVGCLFKLSNN